MNAHIDQGKTVLQIAPRPVILNETCALFLD